ncbi:vitamin K epoxide reductase family protein [Polyangium sp. 15x6]|uniref:vitamin K epoxide reductase family protein n=1 Tax=Polyangium sp. 15x6 TaxID=3042687 RepID=UPI002499EEC3|nr:vitamin K epoxide reductase family protein [Polyangium sp. 15x6]MDI3283272.1 vitamin K epoxide reductase family protein [Polyangium sp. 15x6]
MRTLPVLLLRLPLLVAIAASSALVVEYTNAGDPAFCGVTSGCFAVRMSPWSRLFGLAPLPSLGLAAYALLFGLTLVARRKSQHVLVASLAVPGGLFAAFLLWLQKTEIGAFCAWCVAVDLSAIVAASASVWVALRAWKDEGRVLLPQRRSVTTAWVAAAMFAVLVPFVWGRYPVEPPLPAAIQTESTPGKVTIVGFTDFECPFCRRMHPVLHGVAEKYGDRVKLVRKMMPLSGHPGAEPAALAYLCTPLPKRETVADELYAAEPEALTRENIPKLLAQKTGLDAEGLASCMNAPETRAELERDKKLFEDLGGRGLPFTFVGKRVVLGFNPDRVEMAMTQELGGPRLSLPLWGMFVVLGVAFLLAVLVTLMTPVGDLDGDAPRKDRSPSA